MKKEELNKDEPLACPVERGVMLRSIEEILKGIDKQETEDEDGWWETSFEAKFGAAKLRKIRRLFKQEA